MTKLAISLFLSLLCCGMVLRADPCNISRESLARLLARSAPGWRILELTDLESDDQKIWAEAHPDQPPGILSGRFTSDKEETCALLLTKRLTPKRSRVQERLVLLERAGGRYRLRPIAKSNSARAHSVIHKAPAGMYSSAEGGDRISIQFDGIVYERLEAGALLYYWKAGRFRSLQLTE